MSETIKKKPYVTPKVFRVELNPEQAILTACSLATTNASNGGNGSCRPASCKRHTGVGGGDSGARAS